MFEQDYLMKLLLAFYQAMFKSLRRVTDEDEDSKEAADTLDEVVGNAVGMDGASLLSLTPESVVGVLQVSGGRGWTDGERLHLSADEVGSDTSETRRIGVVARGTGAGDRGCVWDRFA